MMATCISTSPEATAALGEEWGHEVEAGWVLALTGDLGAGKTQLVRGLARGLGIKERVHSPTFALLHSYADGRLMLHHLDLYRLEHPTAVRQAGLEEYLYPDAAVAVVEWAERWLGSDDERGGPGVRFMRRVWIELLTPMQRRIRYEDTRA
jgi:tRNA threonylcarbamoyladenosine biosynthesis protein TsaE